MLEQTNPPCPCGSGGLYSSCCAEFHQGKSIAQTPVQLMRSRFSAYVMVQAHYLLNTHHPDFRGSLTENELKQSCVQTKWKRLEIIDSPEPTQNTGYVEFKAWFQDKDALNVMHERSRFKRVDGRWLYCDGEFNPKPKNISRNGPCPCGSGKKYKRCCG